LKIDFLFFLFFYGELLRLSKNFVKFICLKCILWLEHIKLIDFELSPDEICFFRVFFFLPPKSSLHQTLDKESIISLSNAEFKSFLVFINREIFKDNWIKDFMSYIKHKQKLPVRFNFYLINAQIIVIINFRNTLKNSFFSLLLDGSF